MVVDFKGNLDYYGILGGTMEMEHGRDIEALSTERDRNR